MRQSTERQTYALSALVLLPASLLIGAPYAAAQTPNADRIAFQCNLGTSQAICLVNSDGTNRTTLNPFNSTSRSVFGPKWSPDNKRIAFGIFADVWVMNADGTNPVQLAQFAGCCGSTGSPSWSPDGTKLVFSATPGLNISPLQLYVVGTSGPSTPTQLGDSPAAQFPAWSPDGTTILFSKFNNLFRINADGTNPVQLAANAVSAAWSPDGSRVAYQGEQDAVIYVIRKDGSGAIPITGTGLQATNPTWSPDGSRIAFQTRGSDFKFTIGIVNADGSGGMATIVPSQNITTAPDWQHGACAGAGGDTDGDGLCDDWEKNGLTVTVNGIPVFVNLPAMGADPKHKDIFIQADYMVGSHSHKPKPEAITTVSDAFANAPVNNPDGTTGVTLHVDCGADCTMNPKTGDTWGALSQAHSLPHQDSLGSSPGGDLYIWTDFNQLRSANFDASRRPVFHYVVFAHDLGGLGQTSGITRDTPGSDFIVSLGSWDAQVGTISQQAGTFMHELGHNLSLRHGGGDDVNRKPNYLSVMNYLFQTTGGLFINGTQGNFDYSRFTLTNLDESHLNETVGLNGGAGTTDYGTAFRCPGAAKSTPVLAADGVIDWNCNLNFGETNVAANINGDVDVNKNPIIGLLNGFNDWPNLVFSGGSIGQLGDSVLPSQTPGGNEVTPAIDSEFPQPVKVSVAGPGLVPTPPGSSLDLTFTVSNGGTQNDTYALTASANVAWANLAGVPASLALNAGASSNIMVHMTVPGGTPPGTSGQFTIKAASKTASRIKDTGDAIVTVAGAGQDTIPPGTVAGSSPAPTGGWNNTNVNVTLSATDNAGGSGVRRITYSATGSQTISATTVTGANASFAITGSGVTTVSFFAEDNAGNVETAKSLTVRIDRTAPSIHCDAVSPAWSAVNVAIHCTAADEDGSGLANTTDGSFSLATTVPDGSETANALTSTRTVCDVADNCSTAGPIGGNKVDRKPPSITIVSPAHAVYTLKQSVAANYSCADGGSGIAKCTGTVAGGANLDTTSVGIKTFIVTASDAAGNTSTQSVTYTVSYQICLQYDPGQASPAGAVKPIRVKLCDRNLVDVGSATIALTATSVTPSGALTSPGLNNPGGVFTFLSGGGYQFLLSTSGYAPGSYALDFVATGDPTPHHAPFLLK